MEIRKITQVLIIGAGAMGRQIGQMFAQKGKSTLIYDIDGDQLKEARKFTEQNLENRVKKGKITAEKKKAVLNCLDYRTDYTKWLKTTDLIIECVPENLPLKKQIFKALASEVPEGTIIGTNSSTIPIGTIVDGLPEEFCRYCANIHFVNPPLMLRLVEVYLFEQNEKLAKAIRRFLRRTRFKPVFLKKPINGFVMNRILGVAFHEMFTLLSNSVCDPKTIDSVCVNGLNWPIGVARLADLIGLDVIYDSFRANYDTDPKEIYKPPEMLKDLVEKGHLGMKSGRGLYEY